MSARKVIFKRPTLMQFIFVELFVVKALAYQLSALGYSSLEKIHYFVMVICTFGCIANVIRSAAVRRFKSYKFYYETFWILILFCTYLITSIYQVIKNEVGISGETGSALFHVLFPIIQAFLFINTLSKERIYSALKITCKITFVMYFIYGVLPNINEFLKRGIIFRYSYSPFESTFYSYLAFGYCLFFCYYRKEKKMMYLSVVFVFLTFKRFLVVAAAIMLLFGNKIRKMGTVSNKLYIAVEMVTSIVIAGYIYLCVGIFNERFSGFTMSRVLAIQKVLKYNFKSGGLSSSKVFLNELYHAGKWSKLWWSIEMDLPMIYIELGAIAVALTIICLFKITKKNAYNIWIVVCCLIQMLTSAWIDYPFFWLIMYLAIGLINMTADEDLFEPDPYKRRIKISTGFKRKGSITKRGVVKI